VEVLEDMGKIWEDTVEVLGAMEETVDDMVEVWQDTAEV
jgi:hypothetical protein